MALPLRARGFGRLFEKNLFPCAEPMSTFAKVLVALYLTRTAISLDLVGASRFELIQQIFDGDDVMRIYNRAVLITDRRAGTWCDLNCCSCIVVTWTSGTGDKDWVWRRVLGKSASANPSQGRSSCLRNSWPYLNHRPALAARP